MNPKTSFELLPTPDRLKWVIIAPRREDRPNVSKGTESICPFCPGQEKKEKEVYSTADEKGQWQVRVVPNIYPFAEIHEIIIHSPDHHKDIHELPVEHVKKIIEVYFARFNLHKTKGQVCIFHNRGVEAGESIPHPHSQLVVLSFDILFDAPKITHALQREGVGEKAFDIFSPQVSQWPDEVWIAPKKLETDFGQTTLQEREELGKVLQQTILLLQNRQGKEFAYNFVIVTSRNWFVRVIPRQKILGGFELGTGIYITTTAASEINAFLQRNWKQI